MDKYISYKIKNISFLLTILVVILHAYNLELNPDINTISFIQKFISHGIATVAVPIFFMISGFLFFYNFESSVENWIKKYKSRFKSLFIPYFIWCTLWMIILYSIQLIPMLKGFFSNMILSEFSFQEILKYTYKYPIPFQLWYINALIECVIISPLIYYIIKKTGYVSGPILVILWFFNIIDYPIALFSIGCFLSINNISFNKSVSKLKYITVLLLFVIATIMKTYLSYYDFSYIGILGNVVILLGVISIWMAYDQYSDKLDRVFDITKYGIFIYFLHEPLQSFIIRVLLKIFSNLKIGSIIIYIISPVITISICLVIAVFLNRYMNKTYKVLTGGR